MEEDKVKTLMLGIKWQTIVKFLNILKKDNKSHCPWCNGTKWLFITDSDNPSLQNYESLTRVTQDDIVRFSATPAKLSDVSVIMRCSNCGYEYRFNLYHLCQRILEEAEKIKKTHNKDQPSEKKE